MPGIVTEYEQWVSDFARQYGLSDILESKVREQGVQYLLHAGGDHHV